MIVFEDTRNRILEFRREDKKIKKLLVEFSSTRLNVGKMIFLYQFLPDPIFSFDPPSCGESAIKSLPKSLLITLRPPLRLQLPRHLGNGVLVQRICCGILFSGFWGKIGRSPRVGDTTRARVARLKVNF
jgi:hypothetical protein